MRFASASSDDFVRPVLCIVGHDGRNADAIERVAFELDLMVERYGDLESFEMCVGRHVSRIVVLDIDRSSKAVARCALVGSANAQSIIATSRSELVAQGSAAIISGAASFVRQPLGVTLLRSAIEHACQQLVPSEHYPGSERRVAYRGAMAARGGNSLHLAFR